MSTATPKSILHRQPEGPFERNIPGYFKGKQRLELLKKKDPDQWKQTGREVLGVTTAVTMAGNAQAAIAAGSIAPLFTNTIAQPLITAITGNAVTTGPVGLGIGAAVGTAYLLNERRRYVNKMFKEGKNWHDIRTEDFKNVAKAPVKVAAPLWRAPFKGLELGVGLLGNIMMEGSALDKGFDNVIKRGEGTYKGEILETVDNVLNFTERIVNFNPANAFINDAERKKAATVAPEEKKKAA